MLGFEGEGVQISLKKLQEDERTRDMIRQDYIEDLVLEGTYNEEEDTKLFEEVMRHCSQTKKKLFLDRMVHTLPVEKLQIFPLLKKLTIQRGSLQSDALLHFDKWCPNLTEIRFKKRVRLSDAAYDTLISTDVIFPQIKAFAFDFGESDEIGFDRDFLEALDLKFPTLECLDLILNNSNFSSHDDDTYSLPYEPLYFKKLKKLSVFAFGDDVSLLLNYMCISNAKLKEFKFNGMTTPKEMITYIGSCKRLGKLTLDCPYLDEDGLMDLKNMRWLNEVTFEAKYLHWEPNEIIAFARNNQHLKKMVITSDRKNNSMKFGKEFKEMFDELVRERPKLTIKVHFFQGGREIKISAAGFTETQRYETSDSEDGENEEDRDECEFFSPKILFAMIFSVNLISIM